MMDSDPERSEMQRSDSESFRDDTSQSSKSLGDNETVPLPDKVKSHSKRFSALLLQRVVVCAMLVALIVIGALSFVLVKNNRDNDHHEELESLAHVLVNTAEQRLQGSFQALSSMAQSLSTLALSPVKTTDAEFPFYTQHDFESFSQNFFFPPGQETSLAHFVSWSPLIQEDEVDEWVVYSRDNADEKSEIPAMIYKPPSTPVSGPGPFLPIWQMASKSSVVDASRVNFDLLSNKALASAMSIPLDEARPSMSKFLTDPQALFGDAVMVEGESPQSFLLAPIAALSNNVIAGVAVAAISWEEVFVDVLSEDSQDVEVLIESIACDSSNVFHVQGPDAIWVNPADQVSRRSSSLFKKALQIGIDDECNYMVSVYPSLDEDSNATKEAALWTVFVVSLILVVWVSFLIYDILVQKKQSKVLSTAAKSQAIVSSLFPDAVRQRLFDKDNKKNLNDKSLVEPTTTKFRLRDYLSHADESVDGGESGTVSENGSTSSPDNQMTTNDVGVDMFETKPIADLFPNTTIMFADIAGFTAWSSVREPSQVFTLLETVYQAFDVIAKRRHVFKVETVGDCYVAVAGLPEPRPDHAVVMAKFARECLEKFNVLAKQLEISLGPDTADLAMRAGLHSGPVTAGVLRGDKSRFQLFGDSVNMAARIESTGTRNKVHLSVDTSDLLRKAGKEHWLRKRKDLIITKGKGTMQTFWLHTPGSEEEADQPQTKKDATTTFAIDKNAPLEKLEEALPPKVQRLVGWNVEILKKILKQIVAKREAAGRRRVQDAALRRMEDQMNKRKYCLDEVTEIIALPKFDVRAHRNEVDASTVELPEKVVDQLKLYVSAVAAMHREANPFHNFEHASHVTMSVSKLLARIIAPDDVLEKENTVTDVAASLHDHTYGITSDPLTQFGCVLSALIHDTDHAGVSNFQLCKENTKEAVFFKQKSVAEQNSIVLAWEKLMSPEFEELRRCIYTETSELDRFRRLVVNNVLATDIFDKELQKLRRNRWDKAFQRIGRSDARPEDDINRKATVVMEHLIQASDVAHTMQHWHIYQKWNERLFAEMTTAYRAGRMGTDPAINWYQGELGFFDNYIIPLANKLKECGVFGVSSDEYLNYALENRREWANKGEEVVAKYVDKYAIKEGDDDDEK